MSNELKVNEASWIPAEQLINVWGDAQRTIIPRHLAHIMATFDPDIMEPVHVTAIVKAPHFRHIIDGNHRVEAVKQLDWLGPKQRVWCIVHEDCKNAEAAADRFRKLNSGRRIQTGVTDFKVAVTAAHEPETAISKIIRKNGLHLGGGDKNSVNAVGALRLLWFKANARAIDQALATLKKTWPDDNHAFQSPLVIGYGMTFFNNPSLDAERLVNKIGKKFSPGTLVGQAKTRRDVSANHTYVEIQHIITNNYNAQLGDKSRLIVKVMERAGREEKTEKTARPSKANGSAELHA